MSVKKSIMKNAVLGGLLGVFFLNLYLIFLTLFNIFGAYDEYSYALEPFKTISENQGVGVLAQLLVFLLIGAMLGVCFSITKMEQWSLLKQTLVQYVVFAIGLFPFCFFMESMERTFWGYIGYLGAIALIYGAVFAAEYASLKVNVREMNETLEGKEHNKELRFLPYVIVITGMYYIIPILCMFGREYADAVFAANLFNYFLYPFVLVGIGVFVGIKLGFNWIIPASAGALVIPIGTFFYGEHDYTLVLVAIMTACAAIGTVVGGIIRFFLRKGGIDV